MSSNEKNENQIRRAVSFGSEETVDKGTRIGLWIGLGVAAVATIGVLALAFYTDYQENNKAKSGSVVLISSETVETINVLPANEQEAASMALVISESQSTGMEAPADIAASDVVSSQQPENAVLVLPSIDENEASVLVENGVVKFYFASGKSDLGGDVLASLKDIVQGVQAGQKAIVSGYADGTGNVELNERLSKERAFKVRDALIAAGVPAAAIEMQKPQNTTGSGSQDEARRVEVVLQ